MWDESRIIGERLMGHEAVRASLTQAAIGSVLSKKGAKSFQKLIKRLTGDGNG